MEKALGSWKPRLVNELMQVQRSWLSIAIIGRLTRAWPFVAFAARHVAARDSCKE
jgi:branched-subunit amino acid transport protein AzlD